MSVVRPFDPQSFQPAPDYFGAPMIPFDLEAAKRGEPIATRDGRAAVFVGYDAGADERYRVLARVGNSAFASHFRESGALGSHESSADLFMAPKPKRTVYVNVYAGQSCYDNAEDARKLARSSALAIAVPVEIEE